MAKRTRRSERPEGDYEVGYGKPPVATRFQKGQSGNPKGRPKGAQSFQALFKTILDSKVPIRDENGSRTVTVREALVRNPIKQALKGDSKTFTAIFKLVEPEEHRPDPLSPAGGEELAPDDEALIRAFLARRAMPDDEEDS